LKVLSDSSLADMAADVLPPGAVPEPLEPVKQPLVEEKFVRHGSKSRVFMDAEEMKQKVKDALAKPSYNVFDFYHTKGFFQWVAKSTFFEHTTLVVIGLNALWLAHDTNSNDADSLLSARLDFQIAEIFFCAFFALELFVRFMAFKRKCDTLRDGWFVFDSVLVTIMIGETLVLSVLLLIMGPSSSSDLGDASFLTLFRLLRLLRLSRMARMLKSMPELMILIKGMAAATTSVFFVMCLQLILLYVFAIAFTQLASGTNMGNYYFPGVWHSMYTLLLYGTFLDNLSQFCDEVAAESSLCLALVFIFVLLSACTVLNMLIGILCEVVSAVAAVEREEMLVLFVTNKLQRVLSKLDRNNDGHLCKAEFLSILQVDEAARALEEVGVDPVSIVDFADFIFGDDPEGEGENLSFGKFMDILLTLRAENKSTIRDMISIRSHVANQVDRLVKSMCREVPKFFHLDKEPGSPLPPRATSVRGRSGATEVDPAVAEELRKLEAKTVLLEDMMGELLGKVRELGRQQVGPPLLLPGMVEEKPLAFRALGQPTGRRLPSSKRNKPSGSWGPP